MMMKADKVYLDLLQDILDNGTKKSDRTGTGTISLFSRDIRFNMADGFPLLTTKKLYTKGIISELLWFLDGDTNIQTLVKQSNLIWVGDAYKYYVQEMDKKQPAVDFKDYHKINTKGIMTKAEFIWNIENDDSFAHRWGDLGPIYGHQWVNWGGYDIVSGEVIEGLNKGINQIQKMIDTLKTNPDSRRMIVNSWNVADLPKMKLPPCHYGFELNAVELTPYEQNQWKWENDGCCYSHDLVDKFGFDDEPHIPTHKLSLKWIQRSVDTFLGLPFNIASYAMLLHMFAKEANMVPNELIGSLGDVHIYSNHIEQVKEQLSREPKELPKLVLKEVDDIFSYNRNDFEIIDYDPHPPIKAELSN